MDRKSEKVKEKEKTPAIEAFPTDETPTPTKILRMADIDLFPDYQDIKDNPFDVHFRKAVEAAKQQGADSIAASINAPDMSSESESLNTPQIFVSDSGAATVVTTRPVILRPNSHSRTSSSNGVPVATVLPSAYKPIAPAPATLPVMPGANNDNALLLLKFPSGETIKLSNLPFVKSTNEGSPVPQLTNNVTENRLNLIKSQPVKSFSSTSSTGSSSSEASSSNVKEDLKERNRMSAQRSRIKKRRHVESLVDICGKQEKENDKLKLENKRLQEENTKLRRLLSDHLDLDLDQCVTLCSGSRDALSEELTMNNQKANPRKKIITNHSTETHDTQYENIQNSSRISNETFQYNDQHSPPQTYPQDLRVDTRIKDDERSQVANLPRQLVVRKTVIEPYEVQATQIKKAKKGGGATRLKDKLSLIKQKLAEDENILTEIKSGKLQ